MTANKTQSPAWERVELVLTDNHYKPDTEAARALYSCVAAHRLDGPPVWPMLVAPPGSLKTELLNALDGLPGVHMIDSVTPQTFISGQLDEPGKPKKVSPSLLVRIGKEGVIVYPDFSTLLAMNTDKRAQILADMRRIYDGKLRKEYGTSENAKDHEWTGRITFVVAVTPEIDRYYSVFSALGERFVMIRWPRAGGVEAALIAMNQDTAVVKAELRKSVHELFAGLPGVQPKLSDELKRRIAALCEVAVRGRTHVLRDGHNKDIIYVPEAESNTRLAQQLVQLARGSALLDGRCEVNDDDFALVKRVALDCMPPLRAEIVRSLCHGDGLGNIKAPVATMHYAKGDLQAQDLLNGSELSDLARELLEAAGMMSAKLDAAA